MKGGISKPPFNIVQYVLSDTVIDGIMARGCVCGKFDVANDYRNVAIHLNDCP